jgi:hypothetical protein
MLLRIREGSIGRPKKARRRREWLAVIASLAVIAAMLATHGAMAQGTVRLNGGKCPRVNGKPFFAIGMYSVGAGDFPALAKAGFNVVHTYDWEGTADNTAGKAWLDAAAASKLKALVGLYRPKVKASDFDRQCVRRIELYRNHPSLLAWHTMDEPQWDATGDLGKDYMPAAKAFVAKHDPRHPVTAVVCRFIDEKRFADSVDIMQADYYPIPPLPSGDFAGDGFRGIKLHVDQWREASGGRKPFWFVCQAFDYSLSKPNVTIPKPWQRFPTARELRTMSYVAVASGARGIFYWSLTRLRSEVRPGGTTAEEHWNRLRSVTLELRELAPMLAGDGEETIAYSNSVVSMVKRHRGRTYVIAANYERKPTETAIRIPGVDQADAKVLFSEGSARITGGLLRVRLDSIESRVYRIETNGERQ